MVELGWTAVNVMYVEYVFVGHGLIDYYCRPAAAQRTKFAKKVHKPPLGSISLILK